MSEATDLLIEFDDVFSQAKSAILEAMSDGYNHGYRGNWQGQSTAVHVSHAFQHIEKAMAFGLSGDEAASDLTHALTRLAMALIQWDSNS